MIFIGIDMSKEKFNAFLTLAEGSYHLEFENRREGFRSFWKWLKKRRVKEAHVCLEATGRYGDALARFLYEKGLKVSVVNPRRIKAYAESKLSRNKTDRVDAEIIEDFCRTQNPGLWEPPAPEVEALQMMTRHLEALKKMRAQERNRLASGVTEPVVQTSIEAHIAYLDEAIANLEQEIQNHIDQHPHLKEKADLLQSIPGIGKTTAATLLAEIKDIDQFDEAADLAAYAGLTPGRYQSGASVRKRPHLSKIGNAVLRKALYFPALVAQRHNPLVRRLVERLAARGKPPMVIQGAAMRKLLHIVFGVWKHQRPFDPHIEDQWVPA